MIEWKEILKNNQHEGEAKQNKTKKGKIRKNEK